jgi:hypothetical protein
VREDCPRTLQAGEAHPRSRRGDRPLRALECRQAGHRRRQRAGAAFVFDLPVGRYGLIDFPSIDPIVEAGYRYATTAIETLPPEIPRGSADQ